MASSDQINKLKQRNEQLQKQLEGSKQKVSDLQDKLKRTRSPPPLPQDDKGPDKDPGDLEKKLQELTEKLAKQQEDLRAARVERDEFAEQLRTLREKLVASENSQPKGEEDEPEYDPETQKYKLSWVGDSLKDVGKKGPPAEKKKEPTGMDRRTTEEKMAAMAVEKQALDKGKPAQKVEKPREKPGRQTPPKAEPEGEKKEKQKKDEEELEETASYSVEELLERAEGPMDFEALKDMQDRGAEVNDGPTVPGVSLDEMLPEKSKKAEPEDSDVAVVTSESGGRPVLRMHAVPDEEVAEPTLQEPEESLVTESREEVITDKRTDQEVKQSLSEDDSEVMTEEKVMVKVPPPVSKPLFPKLMKAFSDHRALILKSLLFLAGAGLGVGLALLIFLGPDTKEPGGEEGAGEAVEEPLEEPAEEPAEESAEAPAETPAGTKSDLAPAVASAGTKSDLAPAELVEPIYRDAAIMDKQEAVKVGASLKVFVGKYPKDPLLRYHYARALYHKGDVDAAIVQLEESRKLSPDMPEVHYMLGGIYLRMGDEKKAHDALNNFTRLTGNPTK